MLLFDPNILAHGRYSTTDLGGTLFISLSAYLLWRFYQRPTSKGRLVAGGVSLGLAYSSKLSALAFAPIFGILLVLSLYEEPWNWRRASTRLAQFSLMNLLALAVVWASFGFQWGTMQFASPRLMPLESVKAPMPTFWAGIEQVLLLSEGGRPAFLLGKTSTEGFLGYFPVAFLVKTPLATLILIATSAIFLLRRRPDRNRALFLILPPVFYFLVTMQSGLNIGYRHLLPTLPFLYVMIAGFAGRVFQPSDEADMARIWHRASRPLALGLVGLLLATTLSVHPHYLSYFNLAAGGPANGYKILIDSNLDWGQDLLRLQKWMRDNEVHRVKLSWFGTADPQYYGLSYDPLPGLPRHFDLWWNVPFDPQDPEPGIYVISASNLWELPLQDEKVVFPWFRARPPDDRVAYSLLIYEVK
jgi:4-amino-4-deoxy-L-arabinose transferase-like glycosyltransferase